MRVNVYRFGLGFKHFSDYAIIIDKVSLAPEDVAAGAGVEIDGILINSDSEEATVTMVAFSLIASVLALVFIRQCKKGKFMR